MAVVAGLVLLAVTSLFNTSSSNDQADAQGPETTEEGTASSTTAAPDTADANDLTDGEREPADSLESTGEIDAIGEPARRCVDGASIDLLSASAEEISELRGINIDTAAKLVDLREGEGFDTLQDIIDGGLAALWVGEIAINGRSCMSNGESLNYVVPTPDCQAGALSLNESPISEIAAATGLTGASLDPIERFRPFKDLGQLYGLSIGPRPLARFTAQPVCLGEGIAERATSPCPEFGVDLRDADDEQLLSLGVLGLSQIDQVKAARSVDALSSLLDLILAVDYETVGHLLVNEQVCLNSVSLASFGPSPTCDHGQRNLNTTDATTIAGTVRLTSGSLDSLLAILPVADVDEILALDRGRSHIAHLALADYCVAPL